MMLNINSFILSKYLILVYPVTVMMDLKLILAEYWLHGVNTQRLRCQSIDDHQTHMKFRLASPPTTMFF